MTTTIKPGDFDVLSFAAGVLRSKGETVLSSSLLALLDRLRKAQAEEVDERAGAELRALGEAYRQKKGVKYTAYGAPLPNRFLIRRRSTGGTVVVAWQGDGTYLTSPDPNTTDKRRAMLSGGVYGESAVRGRLKTGTWEYLGGEHEVQRHLLEQQAVEEIGDTHRDWKTGVRRGC